MVVDALTNGRLLIGVGIAVGAVIFWSSGFVVAHYLWNRWRGSEETDE
ncbi:hypothetical protein GCM10027435_00700 [Haloparvum alkalitolerans]